MVRIFLVDDNAVVRSCLRTALEKEDEWVVVGEAEDGSRAIEEWDSQHPQLTVMDLVMPEMDGLEASRQLSKRNPDTPILMATIDPSAELEVEAKKAGIRGLVTKSDVVSLIQAVKALLKGKTYFPVRTSA